MLFSTREEQSCRAYTSLTHLLERTCMRSLRKMATKYTISNLPVAPSTMLLTHKLNPDPNTGLNASSFRSVIGEKPSIQRRARLVPPECHYSYVAPFPLPFPYNVDPPTEEETENDTASYIEKWLAKREAVHRVDGPKLVSSTLTKYSSSYRTYRRLLIGLSQTGLQDCLPHLDVGDALSMLGKPALVPSPDEDSRVQNANLARDDLIDILSGHSILLSETDGGFAPWSLRYSGHQFGSFAGQLGSTLASLQRRFYLL